LKVRVLPGSPFNCFKSIIYVKSVFWFFLAKNGRKHEGSRARA
jgi:hypothetical protein